MRRRTFLGSTLAAASTPAAFVSAGRARADAAAQLTVVSWGGSYQDGQSKSLFQPAAKALGISVKEETYSGLAELRLREKSGAVTWDVVCTGSGTGARAGIEGLVEPLDYKAIDVADFIAGSWAQYYVGGDAFSTVIAWNTKTYGEAGPQSWADFWDVKKFPGTRSYRNTVTLEPALLADGVPLDQVYKVLSAPGGIESVQSRRPHSRP